MSKKTKNKVKAEAIDAQPQNIKFQAAESIFKLMNQWLMTLQEVYTEYHKQVTGAEVVAESRDKAIGSMLLLIDFIDAPEQTILPNLRDEEAKVALKGMLASARQLKEYMRTSVELERKTEPTGELSELAEDIKKEMVL